MRNALRSRLTFANGIPDRSGVYHGCVDPKTGALRVAKTASSCRKTKTVRRGKRRVRILGESAIAWNQQGPQGVPGQSGSNATVTGVAAGGDLTGSYPNPLIGAGKVTGAKLATGAVGTSDLSDGSVTGVKVAGGTLRLANLAVWTMSAFTNTNPVGANSCTLFNFGSPTGALPSDLVIGKNDDTTSLPADCSPSAR